MPDLETAGSITQELVAQAQSGDVDAFGMLYEMHMPAIYRYIYHQVSSIEEAEDLTEEVFLRAWRAMPRFQRGDAGFLPWLYRIARNAVIDHYRTARTHVPFDGESTLTADGDCADSITSAEEHEALLSAVSTLPEEQRQVIILRFFEGLTHSKVAAILGKSEGACRTIQYRALRALSVLLEGKG